MRSCARRCCSRPWCCSRAAADAERGYRRLGQPPDAAQRRSGGVAAEGKAVRGKPEIKADRGGLTYSFRLRCEPRRRAQQNPQKYLPAAAGFRASGAPYALKASIGAISKIGVDSRLYLFGNERARDAREMDEKKNVELGGLALEDESRDVPSVSGTSGASSSACRTARRSSGSKPSGRRASARQGELKDGGTARQSTALQWPRGARCRRRESMVPGGSGRPAIRQLAWSTRACRNSWCWWHAAAALLGELALHVAHQFAGAMGAAVQAVAFAQAVDHLPGARRRWSTCHFGFGAPLGDVRRPMRSRSSRSLSGSPRPSQLMAGRSVGVAHGCLPAGRNGCARCLCSARGARVGSARACAGGAPRESAGKVPGRGPNGSHGYRSRRRPP
ncbi:MAG: hypothetical protein MZW92_21855 [Comamonadaceae bacterium]|nr:hypothetical protein [Comamonadaceae bacterium]